MTTNAQGQEVLQGDGTWPFTVTVDGTDLTVHTENITTGAADAIIIATYFGGTAEQDPDDNGETASGLSTRDNPELMGCALPMHGEGSEETDGSPLPKMPYRTTEVGVFSPTTNRTVRVPIVDLGPAKDATSRPNQVHAIDLTRAAFAALGGDFDQGWIQVEYRVLDGAQYVGQ